MLDRDSEVLSTKNKGVIRRGRLREVGDLISFMIIKKLLSASC